MISIKIDMIGFLRFKKLRIPFYWKWYCKFHSCNDCCWCRTIPATGHGCGVHDKISYCGLIAKFDSDYRNFYE